MLSQDDIRDALHASRVVPLDVPNPHGPLGLEHLAEAVKRAAGGGDTVSSKVQRPVMLSVETWEKLNGLARAATHRGARPLSASDVAAALIETVVKAG